MTMASRDIANMHIFLDLKKKFPDLPDETLRNYIVLYAEDKDKCVGLLQKESENYHHPSQPFSDFRLPESKSNSRKNDNLKTFLGNLDEDIYLSPLPSSQQTEVSPNNKMQIPSGRSTSHAGVVHFPGKLLKPDASSKPESHSAPVITNNEKPFNNFYKVTPASSHITPSHVPSDRDNYNQMMFSTTKEHIIVPPPAHESMEYFPVSAEQSKRHAVKLSITPYFPFQQHVNVFNNSVCATASHSSRPGRHTTSLNFQLQPQSSNQYPLEISTIPTNIGSSCNSRDFGSHVQISVGSQGATFTALRLQRPNYSQTQNVSHLASSEESSQNYTPSSQVQNSSVYLFPNVQQLISSGATAPFVYSQGVSQIDQKKYSSKSFSSKLDSIHGYKLSPEYIQAVKNHQIAQLDLILNELEKEKSVCSQLKAEVKNMEQEVTQRNSTKTSFIYSEELNKLREENRRLRIECNCLLMEVDMCSSTGQIPLGVTDEDFYSNIFTGPNGAIISSTEKTSPKLDKERLSAKSKKSSFEDDEDDERNRWKCKKCTFANHPALEKCEMCELPKGSGSFFADN